MCSQLGSVVRMPRASAWRCTEGVCGVVVKVGGGEAPRGHVAGRRKNPRGAPRVQAGAAANACCGKLQGARRGAPGPPPSPGAPAAAPAVSLCATAHQSPPRLRRRPATIGSRGGREARCGMWAAQGCTKCSGARRRNPAAVPAARMLQPGAGASTAWTVLHVAPMLWYERLRAASWQCCPRTGLDGGQLGPHGALPLSHSHQDVARSEVDGALGQRKCCRAGLCAACERATA